MTSVDSLLSQLESCVSGGHVDAGKALLSQIKLALLERNDSAQSIAALECGVLLAVQEGDLSALDRHMQQLQPLYANQTQASPRQPHILGIYLMYLLVENRLSEFHSQLEVVLLQSSLAAHPLVNFPIALERQLMVGMYDEVLQANIPHPSYQLFMDHLLLTVRDALADAMEVAYHTLTLAQAAQLLKLESVAALQEYLQQNRPDWIVEDNMLCFSPPETNLQGSDVPSLEWMQQSLSYATEMERIV